jgi:hypothetical protein
MTTLPLVISFYTIDTPYEEEVQHLIKSCKKFDIPHRIEGVPSSGSWSMNCAFKPIFILQKLEELRRPLLWVDADAVFLRKMEPVFDYSSDFGVRLYDCPDDHPSRIVSATLFINATERARNAVKLWAEECIKMFKENGGREVWDQDALRRVLLEKEGGASFSPLPVAYSKISGHPDDEKECSSPVILQNQASRRYKRWVNHPEERIPGW